MTERKQIKGYQLELEEGNYSGYCFFANGIIRSEQVNHIIGAVAYDAKNNIFVYRFDENKKEDIENILGLNIQIARGAPLEQITRHPDFTPGIGSSLRYRQKADIARIIEEYRRVLSKK